MKSKFSKLTCVLFMMIMFCTVFTPVVSAQADFKSQEETLETIIENVEIIYDTPSERIATVLLDDDSILYIISKSDSFYENRVNFAFIKQDELVSINHFNKNDLDDPDFIINSLSRIYYEFWDGSYIQTFGNNVTGGFDMYLSPEDAEFVFKDGGTVAGALATVIIYATGIGAPIASAAGAIIKFGMSALYKFGKESDGSITITVLYAMVVGYIAGFPGYIRVGSVLYRF